MVRSILMTMVVGLIPALAGAADLAVTSEIDKGAVALGEDVELTVTIRNKVDLPTTVRPLPFGEGGLEVNVTMGIGVLDKPITYRFSRVIGGVNAQRKPVDETLAAGKSITGKIKIPALIPGKMTVAGFVWGSTSLRAIDVQVSGKGKEVRVKIDTEHGAMDAHFFPEVAPNTVANFVRLARDGFYNGLTFHRLVSGFMIQGGDPDGTGGGGPGYSLRAEFNKKLHVKGVLSMARSGHPDSAGSQFFVMHGRSAGLDGKYTGYGELVSGTDTLDKIASQPVRFRGRERSDPLKKPTIKKMTVYSAAVTPAGTP